MSQSTTITRTPLSVLTDYELHHSGSDDTSQNANVSASNTRTLASYQPSNWPTQYRRVPMHRPANRNLDFAERPAGTNNAEMVFIQVMLHGVWLNSTLSRLWRHTGGRINNKIFHYEVGSEW